MKRMLLLGGSHAEIPMIQAAKKLGYYVITTGNQTEGMGHAFANEYVNCDFSNKEAILTLAKEKHVDAICSGCNDFAYLSAAYACEKLGLSGHDSYETAKMLHHKDKYRGLADSLGIVTPKAARCASVDELLKASDTMQFPIIVKPVDLTGGKGMMRCDDYSQLTNAFTNAFIATREEYVVAEEFVRGSNHGFSAFIQQGKVTFYFVDNEQYFCNPYLVSGASAPGDVPQDAIEQLCCDCQKLVHALKLKDGILHIQFILRKDNIPVIIEVCRRAPGDLYIHLVELATGVPYPEYIVAAEAGISLPTLQPKRPEKFFVRHCVMTDKSGEVADVRIAEELKPYILEKLMWYKKGEIIEDVLKYKAGILFLKFTTEDEYRRYLPRLTTLIQIQLKD